MGDQASAADAESGTIAQLEAMWTALIDSIGRHRALWFATFEAFTEGERSPQLRRICGDEPSAPLSR